MGKIQVQLRDYSDEYTSTGINVADMAGVSTWDVMTGLADAFVTHVEAHALGTVVDVYGQQDTQAENDARPANAFAQRELGMRFYVRDQSTQKLHYFTIGTADLGIGSVVAGSDELDLTAAPTAAFKTWIDANLLSPDGNAVVLERAVIVGRNS